MKTVEQWAQELPEDVREKFLANVIEQRGQDALKWKLPSLSEAIAGCFAWCKSPETEGNDFWCNIYEQLLIENR